MRLTAIVLTSATALMMATAVQAADPIMPAPIVPVTPIADDHDWSGFYAGVNAGYGTGEAVDAAGATLGGFDDVSGMLGGVQIGANAHFDMFVLGAETDIQITGMEQTVAGESVALDYFGTVRARAGFAVDSFMPYVTGGFAYGQVSANDGATTETNTHYGWTVGGGVEVAVNDNLTVKGEYLYTDLHDESYFAGTDVGLQFHTVRAGLNFYF